MRRPPPWKAGKQGRGFGRKGERERRLRQRGYGRRVAGCGLQAAGGGWQAAGAGLRAGGRRAAPGRRCGEATRRRSGGCQPVSQALRREARGRPWQTTSAGFAAARRGSLRAGRQRETPAARLADGVAFIQRRFALGAANLRLRQFRPALSAVHAWVAHGAATFSPASSQAASSDRACVGHVSTQCAGRQRKHTLAENRGTASAPGAEAPATGAEPARSTGDAAGAEADGRAAPAAGGGTASTTGRAASAVGGGNVCRLADGAGRLRQPAARGASRRGCRSTACRQPRTRRSRCSARRRRSTRAAVPARSATGTAAPAPVGAARLRRRSAHARGRAGICSGGASLHRRNARARRRRCWRPHCARRRLRRHALRPNAAAFPQHAHAHERLLGHGGMERVGAGRIAGVQNGALAAAVKGSRNREAPVRRTPAHQPRRAISTPGGMVGVVSATSFTQPCGDSTRTQSPSATPWAAAVSGCIRTHGSGWCSRR